MATSTHLRSPYESDSSELRSLRMFCNVNDDSVAEFDSLGTPTSIMRGTKLFQEDDPSGGVFLICAGQIKLSCTSREGRNLIIRIAMPGEVLGLGAVIAGARHEVTAEAIEPSQVKIIRREKFLSFLKKHGAASLQAAKVLSEEYKAAFFDARRLALMGSAAARLATLLLDWGRAASTGQSEMRFTMALTHEELANMVGSSRETVTRMLSRFKREKLIQVRGSSILILAPEKLEALAE